MATQLPNNSQQVLSKDAVDTVIAELVVGTQSQIIKQALQIYQYGKTIRQLESDYNRLKVNEIRSALEYLNADEPQAQFLKPELINNLICRIQNLLPEKCGFCSNIYCSKNDDPILLPCSKCGQDVHRECILNKLDIDNDINSEDVKDKVNPLKLHGLYYFCPSCEEAIIPSKTSSRKIKRGNSLLAVGTPPVTKPSTPLRSLPNLESIINSQNRTLPTPIISTQLNESSEADKSITFETVPKKVCRFFKKGTCKHGLTGKKCKFDHPKVCEDLVKHGTKKPLGCNKGKSCEKFHPKMCSSSLTKHQCFDSKCKHRHVKGTQRKRPTESPSVVQTVANISKKEKESFSFLDYGKTLKTEILEAVEMKIVQLISQLQLQPTPPYPMNPNQGIYNKMIPAVQLNSRQVPLC